MGERDRKATDVVLSLEHAYDSLRRVSAALDRQQPGAGEGHCARAAQTLTMIAEEAIREIADPAEKARLTEVLRAPARARARRGHTGVAV